MSKMSISVKIFEKFRFWSKILEMLFSIKKISIFLKKNFRISIWIQNFENLDFGQNFLKISVSERNFENFDCGQNYLKFRFRTKISKISISVKSLKKFDFRP